MLAGIVRAVLVVLGGLVLLGGLLIVVSQVFLDPSSGRQMRVLADAATGERRYRAEG